jgi:hypothetical protein
VALGSWAWGEFAADVGLRAALTASGLTSLASLLAARWLPFTVQQIGALDPHARRELTPPSVDLHATSGPIVVVIEYRVPSANAVEFVALINEVGRIRRRDGARAWSIGQDVDANVVWVERFEFPTWLDYLRWRTRPTLADQAARERLVRLVEGGHGHVRRLVVRPVGSQPLGAVTYDEQATDGRGLQGRW